MSFDPSQCPFLSDQIVNIWVSIATCHLCLYNMEIATDDAQTNDCSHVPAMPHCVYLQGTSFVTSGKLSGLPPLIPGDKPDKQACKH